MQLVAVVPIVLDSAHATPGGATTSASDTTVATEGQSIAPLLDCHSKKF